MAEFGRDLWRSPDTTPPAQAGPPRADYPGPYPDGFCIPPRRETLPHPSAMCTSAWSASESEPFACSPVTGHHWKGTGSVPLCQGDSPKPSFTHHE